MGGDNERPLGPQDVPLAVVAVVVAHKEELAGGGEGEGGDEGDHVVVDVHCDFVVGPQVVQAHAAVLAARGQGVAVGEEGEGVDVGLVPGEHALRAAGADVPHAHVKVAAAGGKDVRVADVHAGNVPAVADELAHGHAALRVPLDSAGVPGDGEHLVRRQEAAPGKEARVPVQLDDLFAGAQPMDRADVVQAARGRQGAVLAEVAAHHPAAAEVHGRELVRRRRLPQNHLPVLGGAEDVAAVVGPAHCVDLAVMAL